MKFLDLLKMSANNLWRRKLRTSLTILGVVIGTASIIVMMSLGIGLNYGYIEQIKNSGSLTTIQVYNYGQWNGSGDSKQVELTDEQVEIMKGIDGVEIASPVLSISVLGKQKGYEGYLQIKGITLDAINKMNLPVAQGELPKQGDTLKIIAGYAANQNFYDPKGMSGGGGMMVMGGEGGPDIDFINQPVFTVFDTDAYYQFQNGEEGAKMPKKYQLYACATLEQTNGEYDWNIYADIDALKTQLKKVFGKDKVIPGQPSTKAGKPYKYYVYDEAMVIAKDMEDVTRIQDEIKNMGFQAYSNMDYLNSMQESSKMIQAVLGGIGAVSLLVAAIGIANTMLMSIMERTKEIGIMKVLGCGLRNIRNMFLMEAGMIGFVGGSLGIAFSYAVSFVVNKFAGGYMGMNPDGTPMDISVIPIWLILLALAFAVGVGIVSGLYPSIRAMKLSPLAAIRSE